MRSSTPGITFSLVAFGCGACAHAPPLAGRFLYEVTCQTEAERFDTAEKKKMGEYDLATRPGAQGLIPTSVGVLEVCLAGDTVFDPAASVFHTVVPTHLEQSAAGTLSYRLLTFSVPGLALTGQAPAGSELSYSPELELTGGGVRVIPPDEPWATYVDLSTFAPDPAYPKPNFGIVRRAMLLSLSEKLFEPRILGLFCRGIAPNGVAFCQNMDRDAFVDLGTTFPEAVVMARGADRAGPAVVFADR
jgi:hypothetical protein